MVNERQTEGHRFNAYADRFAQRWAREYAVARPSYSEALFDWLSAISPGRRTSWDVGTGTGQVAVGLATRFEKVFASDTNKEFLSRARQHPNIIYNEWPAEQPELEDNSIDLVTSGMAAQWFQLDQFYSEVRRVMRPGGVLAIFGFFFFEIEPTIDLQIKEWYFGAANAYVAPEVKILQDSYRGLHFPFTRLDTPEFDLRAHWTSEDMVAFLSSWGMVNAAQTDGLDVLTGISNFLHTNWGEGRREVRWPLTLLATRL